MNPSAHSSPPTARRSDLGPVVPVASGAAARLASVRPPARFARAHLEMAGASPTALRAVFLPPNQKWPQCRHFHGYPEWQDRHSSSCSPGGDSGEVTTMTRVSQAGRMPEPRARSLQPGLSRSPRERKVTGRSNCLHCTLAHRSLIRELDILSPEGQLSRMIWG